MLNNESIENNEVVELNEEELDEVAGGKGSGQYVKATGDVYIREKPDKNSGKKGLLHEGEKVAFKGESRNDDRGVPWYKVSKGWVSSKYSKIVSK